MIYIFIFDTNENNLNYTKERKAMNLKQLLTLSFVFGLMLLTDSRAEINSGEKNMPNQIEKIKQIENGLRPKYFVKGDKLKSIDEVMKEMHIPGISVAIINNFEVVWSKGYGIADIETKQPVDENTIFQAASISKPVTAMAVMKMVQDGKLDLDKNINTYLKSWQLPENEFTAKKAVTLKNLLSHNAGVTVHGFPGYKPDVPFPSLVQVLNGETPANTGKIFVDMEPETQWRYAGGGTTIVQQAMIDQENKSFQEIMQERVLNPIGMSNSFYSNSKLNEKQLKNATAGHYPDSGEQVVGKRHIYPEMAAAGLWTTAEDLAKFAVEIQKSLKGESNRVLNNQFTEIMTTPILKGEYNIGLANENISEEKFLGHGGGNEGYNCDLLFHKTKGYGVALMTNTDNGAAMIMQIFRSAAKVYGWDNILPPDFEEIVLTDTDKKHFCGSYQMDFDKTVQIYLKDNNLAYKLTCDDEYQMIPVSKQMLIKSDRTRKVEISADFDKLLQEGNELKRISDGEKLAGDYIETGDVEKAVKCYKELMEKDADAIKWLENYLNNAGYYFLSQNNFKVATGFLKTNSIIFPQSGNVWDSLGEVYFFDKKYELSIETMKKALEINPNNQNAISKIKEAEELLKK